jgi:putative hydrolases of HD superfamily
LDALLRLWLYGRRLKLEERGGWKRLGLSRVESVADHSYALALLTMFEAERRKYRVDDAVKMALIHDLEEAITGDLTPEDKKVRGRVRVQDAKRKAIGRVLLVFPALSRRSYSKLWTDLSLSRTKEARLVHEIDKLEMAFQARAYEEKVGRERVAVFYRSAAQGIKDPGLRRALRSSISPEDFF